MSSKRKATSLGLERRVRARREEEWDPELSANDEDSGEEVSEEGDDSSEEDRGSDEQESGSEVCAVSIWTNTFYISTCLLVLIFSF